MASDKKLDRSSKMSSTDESSTGNDDRDGLPSGAGTSVSNDVADPHPATEDNQDRIPNPGGVSAPSEPDIGPNDAAHDGTPRPKPDYRGVKP